MRPALIVEHREFFAKNQCIVFDNLLTQAQVEKLRAKLDSLVGKRKAERKASEDPFSLGRDLWKEEEKPKLLPPYFHETASHLFKKKPLRIGYDQYFSSEQTKNPFKKEQLSLKQMSSLKPVRGAVLIRLSGISYDPNLALPHSPGSALFFTADLPLALSPLFEPESSFYLFVYAEAKTLYVPQQENDPFFSRLKQEGYVTNEPLHEQTHPFVVR